VGKQSPANSAFTDSQKFSTEGASICSIPSYPSRCWAALPSPYNQETSWY